MNEIGPMRRIGTLCLLTLVLANACARWEPAPIDKPVTYSLTAGFADGDDGSPDTRTSFVLNEDESAAAVHWTAGDRFVMLRGQYGKTTFSTNESGKYATFTSQGYLPSTSGACYSFYPADRFVGQESVYSRSYYVVSLPSVQQAVAGGISSGLNLSLAYSTSPTADLTFYNILSYIRFRLEGEAVRQVQSVLLDAGETVAGDLTIGGLPSSISISTGWSWADKKEDPSSIIRLNGPFTPGQDYFIALNPTTLSGFTLYFRDAQGRSICKHSTSSLTLRRSRIYDFGTIPLGDDFSAAVNFTESTVLYRQATAAGKPIDLCVISEGFREEELPRYDSLARCAIDYLLDAEPYKTYRDRFNVYIMSVPSAESGASITNGYGTVRTRRSTFFNARWGSSSYDDMEADEDRVFDFISRNCPSILNGSRTINQIPILMVINDARYGAISHLYADGKGYAMAPYFYNGGQTYWNYPNLVPDGNNGPDDGYHTRTEADWADIGRCDGDWLNIVLHEFGGHVIARLTDEYWGSTYSNNQGAIASQSWDVPFGLNITNNRESPTWKTDLLDRQESLVQRDPNYGRIGIWQGAGGKLFNLWRSEKISCMIDNRPYFSAWQRILIVRRIASLSGTTISLSDFFDRDVTTDPVREALHATPSAAQPANRPEPVEVPMPAQPVLHGPTLPLPRK